MNARGQQGFALLLILLVMLTVGTALFLSGYQTPPDSEVSREADDQRQLRHARQALLGYAAFEGNNNQPGALPCPDIDAPGESGSGTANNIAGCNDDDVEIGRFPHRTIGIDAREHTIWYAIAVELVDDGASGRVINPESLVNGGLTIDGVGGYAAVLIAPGPPLPDHEQTRATSSDQTDPANYLEYENAEMDRDFIDCTSRDDCNDRVIGLSVDDLFAPVQVRVIAEIRNLLEDAWNTEGVLPRPAPFGAEEPVCDPDTFLGILPTVAPGGGGSPPGEPPAGPPDDCAADEYIDIDDLPPDSEWIREHEWIREGNLAELTDIIVYHVDQACTHEASAGDVCGDGGLAIGTVDGFAAVLAGSGRRLSDQDRDAGSDLADFLEPPNADADGSYSRARIENNVRNDVFGGVVVE